jgi:Sel1 repeat
MILNVQDLPVVAGRGVIGLAQSCAVFSILFACQIGCQAQSPLSASEFASVKIAADAGNPAAEDELASQFILQGDTGQALIWYGKSAENGYVHAQEKLGEMLLFHARSIVGMKTDAKATLGSHAINWLTLAAYQGDMPAQADIAGACFNGEFMKLDLIEAYKWGDLAAQAGSASGQSVRNAAILKMSAAQIAEAKRRVAKFIPHLPAEAEFPEPFWVKQITLTGICGATNSPLAIINSVTFGVGDSSAVKAGGKAVMVRCLQIRDKSVLVRIGGLDMPRELTLQN